MVEYKHDNLEDFLDMSSGDIGTLPGSLQLTLKADKKQFVAHQIYYPLNYEGRDRLVDTGVLAQVDEPTDWVNKMEVATRKDGSLRICIDPRSLILASKRGHYYFSVFEHILPDLARAQEYGWTRLLFKLSVSSETFHNRFLQAVEGPVGVACS